MNHLDNRLINLETKYLHQEKQMEELSEALHEQYKLIKSMEKSIHQLTLRLNSLAEDNNPIGPANEKPPHY